MSKSIIRPSMFQLPKLSEKIVLFFSLPHFYMFHEMVKGSKIRSFGPSKRFFWKRSGVETTILGGTIGAALAVITVENAVAAGGRHFSSFGSAGWVGENQREIGELIIPNTGIDETGIGRDYGAENATTSFNCRHGVSTCAGIVSVNSFYRLTIEKVITYRARQTELIDMEASPLNHVISHLGGEYFPLFIVSDQVGTDFKWQNGFGSEQFKQGLKKGMSLMAS